MNKYGNDGWHRNKGIYHSTSFMNRWKRSYSRYRGRSADSAFITKNRLGIPAFPRIDKWFKIIQSRSNVGHWRGLK